MYVDLNLSFNIKNNKKIGKKTGWFINLLIEFNNHCNVVVSEKHQIGKTNI